MKPICSLMFALLALTACTKEKTEAKKPAETPEDIQIMVYATQQGDSTPVATTTILRLSVK